MPTKGRAGEPQIVVDGSNIATEGRSTPSLEQLEEAVTEIRREFPDAHATVVVDATFSHRIPEGERERFESGVAQREYVQPPAGAIGRGDAFLLRIAERVDATVLSNDSFQEFHAEHPWLFERGRLIGATPVPGIGWIFSQRKPVRGPLSRRTVRDASRSNASRSNAKVEKAIAAATKEIVSPKPEREADAGRHRRPAAATAQTVNAPLTFISFIAEHTLGTRLTGEVESFTSHGAVVRVGDMRCYVPLSGLGDPPPRSARAVLRRAELREFVLTALDPQRRGVELALPDAAVVSGKPSEETVKAELRMAKPRTAQRVGTPAKLVLATVAAGGNGSQADGSSIAAGGEGAGNDGAKSSAGPRRNARRTKAAAGATAVAGELSADASERDAVVASAPGAKQKKAPAARKSTTPAKAEPAPAEKVPAATAKKAPAVKATTAGAATNAGAGTKAPAVKATKAAAAMKAGKASAAAKAPAAAKASTAAKAPAAKAAKDAPAATKAVKATAPTKKSAGTATKAGKAPAAAKAGKAAGAKSQATKAGRIPAGGEAGS